MDHIMRQATDGIIWNKPWKILTPWNGGSFPMTQNSAFSPLQGQLHTRSFINLSFIRLAIHSGTTIPLNSLASFPPLHLNLAAFLNLPACDAYGPTPAQHQYSHWLTTPITYHELLQYITYPLFHTGYNAWILLSMKAGNSSGKW